MKMLTLNKKTLRTPTKIPKIFKIIEQKNLRKRQVVAVMIVLMKCSMKMLFLMKPKMMIFLIVLRTGKTWKFSKIQFQMTVIRIMV